MMLQQTHSLTLLLVMQQTLTRVMAQPGGAALHLGARNLPQTRPPFHKKHNSHFTAVFCWAMVPVAPESANQRDKLSGYYDTVMTL